MAAPTSGLHTPDAAAAPGPAAGAQAMPLRPDPAAPFVIVCNGGSGRKDLAALRDAVDGVLRPAGRRFEFKTVDDAAQLPRVARAAVAQARAAGGVVVAAGGDGTVNCVAHAVLDSGGGPDCLFGVLPQGTFNYFGRTHGISQDAAEACRQLLGARAHPVQAGRLNDRVFLVNASLGLYPRLLEARETHKQRYGRSRVVAFWSGLSSLLRGHRRLMLRIEQPMAGGAPRQWTLRTPTLFVGNNRLQLEQIGIAEAPAVERGALVAVSTPPIGRLAMLWLLLRGALGRLGGAEQVDSFTFAQIEVEPALRRGQRRVKIATDGEVAWLDVPLHIRVAPEQLYLLKPDPSSDADEAARASPR